MPDISLEIYVAIGSALAGIIGTWITIRSRERNDQRNLQLTFMAQLIDETTKLRHSVTQRDNQILELQSEVKALQKEVFDLREELKKYESTKVYSDSAALLEAVMNSLPYPAWLHELGENNWYLNDSYCDEFGVKRSNFWQPINILQRYPAEFSAHFISNDLAVTEAKAAMIFEEKMPEKLMEPIGEDNKIISKEITKIPIVVSGQPYVFGSCPVEDME